MTVTQRQFPKVHGIIAEPKCYNLIFCPTILSDVILEEVILEGAVIWEVFL